MQISLATIVLLITLISISLAVFRLVPALGIFLGLLGTGAMVRTIFVMNRARRRGRRMSISHKIVSFVNSIGVIFLAIGVGLLVPLFAGLMMIVVVAVVAGSYEPIEYLSGGIALISAFLGLAAAGWIIWIHRREPW